MSSSRRRKSGLIAPTKRRNLRLQRDRKILIEIRCYAKLNHSLAAMSGRNPKELSVYTELPFPIREQHNGRPMPQWKDLTYWLKIHLIIMMLSEIADYKTLYTFNIDIHPSLVSKMKSKGKDDIRSIIRDRVRKALRIVEKDIPFFFVVEGTSRRTGLPTKLHVHGGVAFLDKSKMDVLRKALAKACGQGVRGMTTTPRHLVATWFYGGGDRWGNYILKFVDIADARLSDRRLTISRHANMAGQALWEIITGT